MELLKGGRGFCFGGKFVCLLVFAITPKLMNISLRILRGEGPITEASN